MAIKNRTEYKIPKAVTGTKMKSSRAYRHLTPVNLNHATEIQMGLITESHCRKVAMGLEEKVARARYIPQTAMTVAIM